jgi:ubiquinone biosynthesis accessory factor UbiJ
MNTTSPFSFPFPDPSKLLPGQIPAWMQPPAWMVEEIQKRIVLALNHVLEQEPEAMARLARQKGRIAHISWAQAAINLIATPAGLLDIAPADAKPDLTLAVTENSPFTLLQMTLRGEKPPIRVEGDVQLAAEVNWLVDHVRWDAEEDLSRIIGDAPAHSVVQALKSMADTLKKFTPPAPASATATAEHKNA